LSNRPGRTRALWKRKRCTQPMKSIHTWGETHGSKLSGKLVAAITITPSDCWNPSISTSNWFNVCFMYCWSRLLRLPPTASNSSMKMIAGSFFRAAAKRLRTLLAPTPTYTSSKSDLQKRNSSFSSDGSGQHSFSGSWWSGGGYSVDESGCKCEE